MTDFRKDAYMICSTPKVAYYFYQNSLVFEKEKQIKGIKLWLKNRTT